MCARQLPPQAICRKPERSSRADAAPRAIGRVAALLRSPKLCRLALVGESHPGRVPESRGRSRSVNLVIWPYLFYCRTFISGFVCRSLPDTATGAPAMRESALRPTLMCLRLSRRSVFTIATVFYLQVERTLRNNYNQSHILCSIADLGTISCICTPNFLDLHESNAL